MKLQIKFTKVLYMKAVLLYFALLALSGCSAFREAYSYVNLMDVVIAKESIEVYEVEEFGFVRNPFYSHNLTFEDKSYEVRKITIDRRSFEQVGVENIYSGNIEPVGLGLSGVDLYASKLNRCIWGAEVCEFFNDRCVELNVDRRDAVKTVCYKNGEVGSDGVESEYSKSEKLVYFEGKLFKTENGILAVSPKLKGSAFSERDIRLEAFNGALASVIGLDVSYSFCEGGGAYLKDASFYDGEFVLVYVCIDQEQLDIIKIDSGKSVLSWRAPFPEEIDSYKLKISPKHEVLYSIYKVSKDLKVREIPLNN